MRKLKRILFVIVCFIVAFMVYVEIANRNSKNMTYRQKVLKAVYPGLMWFTKLTSNKSKSMENIQHAKSLTPLYDFTVTLNSGEKLPLGSLAGKKVLLVNTASDCGYTSQYEDLQKLYDENKDKLVIIAFPANDFKEQEKGNDQQIAAFCKLNFGINFPLATKSSVIKGTQQNEIFKWLSDKKLNGWNEQEPIWNFCKYLVNEQGELINYFGPAVSPISKEVKNAISQ